MDYSIRVSSILVESRTEAAGNQGEKLSGKGRADTRMAFDGFACYRRRVATGACQPRWRASKNRGKNRDVYAPGDIIS